MSKYETIRATPPNIEELESMARDKSSWRVRILAIDELRKWNCKRSREMLSRLAETDAIEEVRIQAIRALEVFGEDADYGATRVPDFEVYMHRASKVFRRMKADEAELEISKVMQLLKDQDPELYDIMEYYKSDKFEEWISQAYSDVRRRQKKQHVK